MSNTNINIPNDIIFEICSRLPAKSLLQFRWVSKYMFDLIKDPSFVKMHFLHHSTINDDRIIINTSFLVSIDSSPVVFTMNIGDVVNSHNDDRRVVNMDWYNLPLSNDDDDNDDSFEFCGSCNGLILLDRYSKFHSKGHSYFLWNPCTGELKELPYKSPNICYGNEFYVYSVLGFGYDHTIDDYKVMKIAFYSSHDDNGNYLNTEINVYTLGSNSWSTKIVADPLVTPYSQLLTGPGLLVNGALHWRMELQLGLVRIMSFDITKEERREIEGPNISPELSKSFLFLRVLNGCLCICQMNYYDNNTDIWIMKDYGVKDSWTKLFTINMETLMENSQFLPWYAMKPFKQYCKDGGILMVFNTKIIVASDPKKNNEAKSVYSIQDVENGFVNETYIESLVSLNSGMYLNPTESRTTTVRKHNLLEKSVQKQQGRKKKRLGSERRRRSMKKRRVHPQILPPTVDVSVISFIKIVFSCLYILRLLFVYSWIAHRQKKCPRCYDFYT